MPGEPGLCPTCFFYHKIPTAVFWDLHKQGHPLAPYNVGKRGMAEGPREQMRSADSLNWRRIFRPLATGVSA